MARARKHKDAHPVALSVKGRAKFLVIVGAVLVVVSLALLLVLLELMSGAGFVGVELVDATVWGGAITGTLGLAALAWAFIEMRRAHDNRGGAGNP